MEGAPCSLWRIRYLTCVTTWPCPSNIRREILDTFHMVVISTSSKTESHVSKHKTIGGSCLPDLRVLVLKSVFLWK